MDNALHRRPTLGPTLTALTVADLQIDLLKRRVTRQARHIDLQPRGFRLLEYPLQNVGRIVTRTMLLEAVWDFHLDPQMSVVETRISRLRAKIDRGFDRELVHTTRGDDELWLGVAEIQGPSGGRCKD